MGKTQVNVDFAADKAFCSAITAPDTAAHQLSTLLANNASPALSQQFCKRIWLNAPDGTDTPANASNVMVGDANRQDDYISPINRTGDGFFFFGNTADIYIRFLNASDKLMVRLEV